MCEHCPTCGTDLSKDRPPKPEITLQEWFDKQATEKFQGRKLLTAEEACKELGWLFENRPKCCGKEVSIQSFLGDAIYAECLSCRKWMSDVSVAFGPGSVSFPNEKVDQNTPNRWVTGQA